MLLQLITLLGALGLFKYGYNMLCSGLLKANGDKMKSLLPWMKANPLKSILAGIGSTIAFESSSATTVMVVGFANMKELSLERSTQVIMGANIGKSVTTWIIALLGFGLTLSQCFAPAEMLHVFAFTLLAVAFVLLLGKKDWKKNAGEVLMGISLMFVAFYFMYNNMPAPDKLPELSSFNLSCENAGIIGIIGFAVIGCLLAWMLQSTTAVVLTLIMLASGWIDFRLAAAMVIGENIGTTFTANIAAVDGNIQAKRAALVHTVFNVIGAVLAIALFSPFINLNGWIISLFGLPNPATDGESVLAAVYGTTLFHTLFNVLNTILLVWFTKFIAKLVCWMVKESAEGKAKDSNLTFINARNLGTPSIALAQAMKEVSHFGEMLRDGFSFVHLAVNEQDKDKFEEYRLKLVKYEELSDKLEYEIANFLTSVTTVNLNENEADKVKVLYRLIGEMESLGDSGENISRILERERVHNRKFDESAIEKINFMLSKVDKAYDVMVENLAKAERNELTDISNAYEAEDRINETRNRLRDESINQIEFHSGNYQSLNYFLDIISELEAMGDFMINVSQSLVK